MLPNSFFPIALGLAFIALISLIRHLSQKQAAEALKMVAPQIGFTYHGADGGAPTLRIHPPDEVRHIMHGTAGGFETVLYYYMYKLGMRRNRRYIAETVAAFRMPTTVADFEMRPESFLDKIGSAFGGQDIDFDSNPEFSQRYLLRSTLREGEAQVRHLFTPALLGFFERLEEGWSVESNGMWLIVYRYRNVVKADVTAYREFIHRTSFIASAVYKSAVEKHDS